jgi:hypothetical protein
VFPLHAPPFGFWFMTMYPSFIPSDDAVQEVITFMVAPLQKTTAHVLAVALMPFTQIFGTPTLRNTRMSCTEKYAVPSLMPGCNVISSIVALTSVGMNNGSALFLLLVSG